MNQAYGSFKVGSCQHLLPNTRLQVLNYYKSVENITMMNVQIRDLETDAAQGPDTVGEIVVKGPHCMLGYFNNEQANQDTFDNDGWMRTGDIGYYDKDGYIYLVDRMKELIKVKGMQVTWSA